MSTNYLCEGETVAAEIQSRNYWLGYCFRQMDSISRARTNIYISRESSVNVRETWCVCLRAYLSEMLSHGVWWIDRQNQHRSVIKRQTCTHMRTQVIIGRFKRISRDAASICFENTDTETAPLSYWGATRPTTSHVDIEIKKIIFYRQLHAAHRQII